MRKLISALILISMIAGCSKRPKDIIDEDKMVAIMADIQIAEAYNRSGKSDPEMDGDNSELLGRGIMESYGVTVAEMDSTLAWYGKNIDEYGKLYKKVDQRLATMQLKYAKAAGESNDGSPSSDLWPYGRHFVVDDNQITNGIVANIPIPEMSVGDRLTWKLRTLGATSRQMILGVEYENGRSEIVNVSNSGMVPWIETTLQTDSIAVVTRIFTILEVERDGKKVFIDSIQLLHHPFNIEEYQSHSYQRVIGAPQRFKDELPVDTLASVKTDSVNTIKTEELKNTSKPSENIKLAEPSRPGQVPLKKRESGNLNQKIQRAQ